MKEENLRSILYAIDPNMDISRSGDTHLAVRCLMAAKRHRDGIDRRPSMTISHGDGTSFAWCWSCGYKKPLSDTLFELGRHHGGMARLGLEVQQAEAGTIRVPQLGQRPETASPVVTYTDILKELYSNPWPSTVAQFMASKGVSIRTAKAFGCAFMPKGSEILLPSGDEFVAKYDLILFPVVTKLNGELECVGCLGRYVDSTYKGTKYFFPMPVKSTNYFFGEQMLNMREKLPIFIVEGPLDMMHLAELGFRSLGNMGLGVSDKKVAKLLASNPKYVILLLDPDAAGIQGQQKYLNTLNKANIQAISRKTTVDPKYLDKTTLENLYIGKQLK